VAKIGFFEASHLQIARPLDPQVIAGIKAAVAGVWIVEGGGHIDHHLSRFAIEIAIGGGQHFPRPEGLPIELERLSIGP
jgi:hypothetical protein